MHFLALLRLSKASKNCLNSFESFQRPLKVNESTSEHFDAILNTLSHLNIPSKTTKNQKTSQKHKNSLHPHKTPPLTKKILSKFQKVKNVSNNPKKR